MDVDYESTSAKERQSRDLDLPPNISKAGANLIPSGHSPGYPTFGCADAGCGESLLCSPQPYVDVDDEREAAQETPKRSDT